MSEPILDCRPLAQPHNPFAHMAAMLRSERYDTPQRAQEAGELARWLDWCAQRTPNVTSAEPLVLAFLARLAVDGRLRQETARIVQLLDQLTAEAAQRTPAAAPAEPANGAGYTIR